jgi:hypothetical protein
MDRVISNIWRRFFIYFFLVGGISLSQLLGQEISFEKWSTRKANSDLKRNPEEITLDFVKGYACVGLGWNPFRDVSYEYYISTEILDSDPNNCRLFHYGRS